MYSLLLTACFFLGAEPDVRIDRLKRLADHLEQIPASKFNKQEWGTTNNPDDPNYIGCLGGHATKIFKSEGFYYSCVNGKWEVTCNGKIKLEATREFFGLTEKEAEFLFSLGPRRTYGITPHQAAGDVRLVILYHQNVLAYLH
jgi:hypothetical protein